MLTNFSNTELLVTTFISVIGGVWTLMKLFFMQEKKLLDERHRLVTNLITSAEEKFEAAVQRLERTREGFEHQLHELEKEFLRYKADAHEKYLSRADLGPMVQTIDKRFEEVVGMIRHMDRKLDTKADK